ncbi:MAG: WhiB family transcriptional regulator [Mycobacteriaceae bacterium]|nr:WhiB family transcriptional regulator [Mycobacteriaceae bacterium]
MTPNHAYTPQHDTRNHTDWRNQAACAKHPNPNLWFPEIGNNFEAKQICQQCPVRTQCLFHAARHNETEGIWGGLTPNQRKPRHHQHTPANN